MSMKGKVAIVTGGGTGLGAAVSTCAAIGQAGGEAVAIQANVAEDADCRHLAAAVQERWGRIDILVNNAGITRFADQGDLDALGAEDFVDIYRVNVVGTYQMVRACAPAMRAAGKGAVVNISFIAGVTGIGSSMAYAASKGALNTMTLSLARSLAPEIRVNAVCPGFIGTRWFADELGPERYAARVKQQEENTLLRRAGRPEDIAVSVLFFCGAGSDHITGETLMPDAGLHLGFAPHVAR